MVFGYYFLTVHIACKKDTKMYKTDILSVSVHILQLNACCLLNVSNIVELSKRFRFVIF